MQVAGPILNEFVFLFDAPNEKVHVFLPNVFYSKIINNQGEHDRLCFVFSEAGGIVAFIVSMGEQSFLQKLVCQDTCLWKPPYGLLHFQVYVSVFYVFK